MLILGRNWERVRELRRGRWFEIERDGELNCERVSSGTKKKSWR